MMTNSNHLKNIIKILEQKYPAPECALAHENPWQLMVATILSAQCTDKRVNLVTPGLFKKFPTISAFAKATQAAVEDAIKSTGFFRNKAKNIIACAQALESKFAGGIPQTLDELVHLPGVGRKTASVILGTAFKKAEGIVVDTHVRRLSQRMGFTGQSDPEKIEQDLMKIVPPKKWIDFSHLLILHGRERCSARRPDCDNCEIAGHCPKIGLPD
ncbi:MAG: endonuclease III [Candidatus Rifleibacteriota bacterium]